MGILRDISLMPPDACLYAQGPRGSREKQQIEGLSLKIQPGGWHANVTNGKNSGSAWRQ